MGSLIDEANRSGGGSSGGSSGGGAQVYWGQQPGRTGATAYSSVRAGEFAAANPTTIDWTDDGARGVSMLTDLAGRKRIYGALVAAGVITNRTGLMSQSVDAAWAQAMQFSASAYAKGQKLTPWDILKMLRGSGGGGAGGYGPAAFSGTRTTTQTDVNLTDKKTARQMAEAILTEQLGRAPDESEYKSFVSALWDEEKANPTKVTTTTTYKAGNAVSSSSKRSGGLDAPGKQDVMEDVIDDSPELAAERDAQLEANYVNVIQRLVGGGGS